MLRDDGGVNAFPIFSGETCTGDGEALKTGGSRIPATIPALISRFAVTGGVGRNMAMGAESRASGEASSFSLVGLRFECEPESGRTNFLKNQNFPQISPFDTEFSVICAVGFCNEHTPAFLHNSRQLFVIAA